MAKIIIFDEDKNAFEGMTKEQITAAILEAVNEGTVSNIDAGFITKLQEQNKKENLKVWVGTMAEFNAIQTKDPETLYLFTDDPTVDDIEAAITSVENDLEGYKATNNSEVASLSYKLTNTSLKLTTFQNEVKNRIITLRQNLTVGAGESYKTFTLPLDLKEEGDLVVLHFSTGGTTTGVIQTHIIDVDRILIGYQNDGGNADWYFENGNYNASEPWDKGTIYINSTSGGSTTVTITARVGASTRCYTLTRVDIIKKFKQEN